ncbi:MAG TPA: ATP-binding cassette domain-containing protein [Nitrososphaerales archaeon]|nr:ATP-binding cassette domain-containing protein [Nitrososphaerales archaeon]
MYAIEAKKISKSFGNGFLAVKGISFNVEEGEIFGLLGPNGAGKTTTIRMIITLTKPTSGTINLLGVDAVRRPGQIRKMIGYVPQAVSVDGDLTAYENLLIYSKLFHVEHSLRKKRIEDALQYMDLADRTNDLVKHFSGGMMRRLEIAQSLVNRPKVLFLDEPSIGLDPNSKRQGWKYVKSLNQEFGVTIFLTTHDMLEADELCDRIAIMNRGEIAIMGSPVELKNSIGGDMIIVESTQPITNLVLPRELGSTVSIDHSELRIQTPIAAELALPRIMEYFSKYGAAIDSISMSKPNLEDVFTKYAKGNLKDDQEAGLFREARVARRSFQRHAG